MSRIVARYCSASERITAIHQTLANVMAIGLDDTTWLALTRNSPTIIVPVAAANIRNPARRCFQNPRGLLTPHASLTALVSAPNTPSDPHTSPSAPVTLRPTGC